MRTLVLWQKLFRFIQFVRWSESLDRDRALTPKDEQMLRHLHDVVDDWARALFRIAAFAFRHDVRGVILDHAYTDWMATLCDLSFFINSLLEYEPVPPQDHPPLAREAEE